MIVGLGLGITAASHFVITAAAEVIRVKKGITAIGNAQIDTAQSKFGGASALFDGTSDGLVTPSNSAFAFGTGDFTIEYWMRPNTLVSYDTSFDARSAAEAAPVIYTNGTTLAYGVGNTERISGGTLSTGTWYHIAVCRSGTSTKLFLNGTQVGSTYTDTNTYVNIAPVYIGSLRGGTGSFDGHIDEVRVSNTARYTANFTPSTTPFVNDENTLLLLHMDGTDASTVFEDDNGVRARVGLYAEGGAQIDTAQSKFGGASALFDGTDDVVRSGVYNDLQLHQTDFTIEGWIYTSDTLAEVINYQDYFTNNGWAFGLRSNGRFLFVNSNGSTSLSVILSSNNAYLNNTWTHFAVVYDYSTTTMKMYSNGTLVATNTSWSTPDPATVDGLRIGFGYGNSGGNFIDTAGNTTWYNGHLDEVRVSNIQRYTSNFTAPTAPFVNDANTLLLLHCDGTDGSTHFEDDNGVRSKKGITAIGNAQIDTAQSKFGGASALFDGTGDYLATNPISWHASSTGTVELFFRLNSTVPFAQGIFSQATQGTANGFQVLLVQNKLYWYKNASNALIYNTALTTGVWYHLAVVKESSTTVKIYVDGTLRYTNTAQSGLTDSTNDFWLGRGYGIASSLFDATRYDLNGWIDEVRISDTARYTANFTAPTEPFQNDSNTLLLLHMDGTDGSTVFTDDNGVPPDYNYGA